MNNLLEIDIKDLIPQKEPFVMVEKLLHCDWEMTKTSLSIKDDNIFVKNGVFSQSGIIENVAQTCAIRLGYFNMNHPVKIGMIGSINDFEFLCVLPKTGQEIITEIMVEAEVGQVILLNANIFCGEKKASGKMKVVLTDTEI
jgi:predicted hotdog family 3-hydroxylacyl-ACP dehydratase